MLKKAVGIGVFIGLVLFFSFLLSDFSFSVGVMAGFIGVAFSLLTYLGASCSLTTSLGLMANSVLLIIVIFKIYGYFKDT